MVDEYKRKNLNDLVQKHKEDQELSNSDLIKELKFIIRNLKLHKERKFLGFYDRLMNFFKANDSFLISFNTMVGKVMFASFLSLILMVLLGILIPAFIINLYSNDGELIWVLWIITFLCIFVAIFERNYMWGRLAIITFSISAGVFTAYLYNAEYIEGNGSMNIPDIIALSLAISAALIVIFETILSRIWKRKQQSF